MVLSDEMLLCDDVAGVVGCGFGCNQLADYCLGHRHILGDAVHDPVTGGVISGGKIRERAGALAYRRWSGHPHGPGASDTNRGDHTADSRGVLLCSAKATS